MKEQVRGSNIRSLLNASHAPTCPASGVGQGIKAWYGPCRCLVGPALAELTGLQRSTPAALRRQVARTEKYAAVVVTTNIALRRALEGLVAIHEGWELEDDLMRRKVEKSLRSARQALEVSP